MYIIVMACNSTLLLSMLALTPEAVIDVGLPGAVIDAFISLFNEDTVQFAGSEQTI